MASRFAAWSNGSIRQLRGANSNICSSIRCGVGDMFTLRSGSARVCGIGAAHLTALSVRDNKELDAVVTVA